MMVISECNGCKPSRMVIYWKSMDSGFKTQQYWWADPKVVRNVNPGYKIIMINWLVVWNTLSIYWECHHPNWRTHIFQRGGSTTNQILMGIFHGNIVRYFVEFQGITFIMEIFFCGGFLWGHPQIIRFFFFKYCRTIINYKPSSTMGMFIYNSNNNGNRMQIYGRIHWISLI